MLQVAVVLVAAVALFTAAFRNPCIDGTHTVP